MHNTLTIMATTERGSIMLENHDEDELFSQGDYERQNISQMLTNVDL